MFSPNTVVGLPSCPTAIPDGIRSLELLRTRAVAHTAYLSVAGRTAHVAAGVLKHARAFATVAAGSDRVLSFTTPRTTR